MTTSSVPRIKPRSHPQGDLDRDARRLLEALGQTGAQPARADLRTGFLAVAAPRAGVTTLIANVPTTAGDRLTRAGLAEWRNDRLHLREEGRSFLRRSTAPAGVSPFLAQHRRISVAAAGAAPALRDETESPVAWLARRKGPTGAPLLSTAQAEAGARFHRDIILAQMLPRVTSDWSGTAGGRRKGGDSLTLSEAALAARQRLSQARDAVGPEMAGLVIDICGFQKGLSLVEKERGWPARSAKIVLGIALERLASHYGVGAVAVGAASGLRAWTNDDNRPDL